MDYWEKKMIGENGAEVWWDLDNHKAKIFLLEIHAHIKQMKDMFYGRCMYIGWDWFWKF